MNLYPFPSIFPISQPTENEGSGDPFEGKPKYRKTRANTPQTARAIAKRQEKRIKRKKAARKARRVNR